MMKTITYEQFLKFDPCYSDDPEKKALMDAIAARRGHWSALDILALDEIPPADRLWAVLREELIDAPILHEFACRCAERALRRVENPDPRSLRAIEVKRAWLRDEATDEELVAAEAAARAAEDAARAADWDAARAAARAAEDAARAAARAAGDAARAAARAAEDAARAAARAAEDAARAAARAADWDAARAAARAATRYAEDAAWAAARAADWDAARAARQWQVEELKKMLEATAQ